jgi:hypothetical protein
LWIWPKNVSKLLWTHKNYSTNNVALRQYCFAIHISLWMKIYCALPNNVIFLAHQFCGAHMFPLKIRLCLKAICLATIWHIWKARKKEKSVWLQCLLSWHVIFNIKIQIWWWVKAKKKNTFVLTYINKWQINLLV